MSGVRSMTARVGKVLLTKVIAHTITQNEHTAEEKAMILRRYPRYKDGMIQLWNSFREIFRCDVGQIGVVSIITLTTP